MGLGLEGRRRGSAAWVSAWPENFGFGFVFCLSRESCTADKQRERERKEKVRRVFGLFNDTEF